MKRISKSSKMKSETAKSPLAAINQYRTTIGLLGAVVLVVLGFILVRSQAATTSNLTGAGSGQSTSCVFSTPGITAAFCESFDTPYTGTKTQTGDLNPDLWGVSRDGVLGTPNYVTTSHNACDGGGTTGNAFIGDVNSTYIGPSTPTPSDARICNGQYVESLNDGGSVAAIDTYPKQPFDFTGRTGTVVFDVTNDGSGNHGAWPEFVITDEPVPGIRSCSSICGGDGSQNEVAATNMVGFSMASGHDGTPADGDQTGAAAIFYTRNGSVQDYINNPTSNDTVTKGCLAHHSTNCPVTKINHYEVKVSKTHMDVYATEPYSGALDLKKTPLKKVSSADINLNFSVGLVWINDNHYNARKALEPCGCGIQYDHSFAWDNLGFDGPKTYRDLGYDVPLPHVHVGDNNQAGESGTQYAEGYDLNGATKTFNIPNVAWDQAPTNAKVVLNVESSGSVKVVLNGHTEDAITKSIPSFEEGWWGTMSFAFPTADAIQGTNRLDISSNDSNATVANISLIMVAGAAVPGGGTVTPTPPPTPPTPPPTLKAGDVNGDGSINIFDASIVAANWGQSARTRAQGDLNGDGIVNIFDGSILSANWGK